MALVYSVASNRLVLLTLDDRSLVLLLCVVNAETYQLSSGES